MEGVVLREHLLEGLSVVERATQRQTNLPVLATVLLYAEKGNLKLTTTNLEFAIQITIPAKITTEGSLAVPHKVISGFVAHLPEGSLSLKTIGKTLSIRAGTQKGKIQGFSPEDFPILPEPPKNTSARFSGNILAQALAEVLPAIAQNDVRPELTGILCDADEEHATFVATDTFRLALRSISRLEPGTDFSVIIPGRAAQEIVRLFDKTSEVTLSVSRTQLEVRSEQIQFLTRLIDGTFPDFANIIPQQIPSQITVNRNVLLGHLSAASYFSGPLNDVQLHIDPKGALGINASHGDIGEYETKIQGVAQGDTAQASFNHRYMFDGVQHMGSQEVVVELNIENKPAVLRDPAHPKEKLYLVMPIRV